MSNVCKFFLQGNCKHGNQCRFDHPLGNVNLNNNSNNRNRNYRRKKNTESFEPSHEPRDMTIKIANGSIKNYNKEINTRDVIVSPNFFCNTNDLTIYNQLLKEVEVTEQLNNNEIVWKEWHGDTHLIADDHMRWKDNCPTFNKIIDRIAEYFNMDIKATRLNWYQNSSDWKPYHRDAAAIDSRKAKTQNFTVAVSFGATRDASFQHFTTKTTVDVPLENGSIYCFAKTVNEEWMHGIPQLPPEMQNDDGRISIIAWGYVDLKN